MTTSGDESASASARRRPNRKLTAPRESRAGAGSSACSASSAARRCPMRRASVLRSRSRFLPDRRLCSVSLRPAHSRGPLQPSIPSRSVPDSSARPRSASRRIAPRRLQRKLQPQRLVSRNVQLRVSAAAAAHWVAGRASAVPSGAPPAAPVDGQRSVVCNSRKPNLRLHSGAAGGRGFRFRARHWRLGQV